MKLWKLPHLGLLLAFVDSGSALAQLDLPPGTCETEFSKLANPESNAELAAYRARKARIQAADQSPPGSPPEPRLKQLTRKDDTIGKSKKVTESADVTRPYLFQKPDGKWVYRRDASGFFAFEADTLDQMLRGGEQNARRVPIIRRYKDGTHMGPPYHTGNPAWDGLVARWPIKNEKGEIIGYKNVGYAGAMEQPYKLVGAKEAGIKARKGLIDDYNYTRSRWAFDIEYDKNGREIWTGRGSIFGHRPSIHKNEWLSETHEHGYGGRPLVDADGTVVERDGSPWMVYERVTRTKDGLPIRTESFARRMKDPYTVYGKGEKLPDGRLADEEVPIASTRPRPTELNPNPEPYPAADRNGMGELVEGVNLKATPVEINGKTYWLGTGSAGNYVDKYGIYICFRRFEDGPIGPYHWVLDENGDMKNFVEPVAEKDGLIWPGRADLFDVQYGNFPDGTHTRLAGSRLTLGIREDELDKPTNNQPGVKSWLVFHAVDEDTLGPDHPRRGWPPKDLFEDYFRSQFESTLQYSEHNGQPWMEILDEGPKR